MRTMPKLQSQLSIEQRYYLFRKSLRKARLKYGREFMTEADRAALKLLTDEQLCQMGNMPDFGEAIATWYKTL
jgi:hypothetical protein